MNPFAQKTPDHKQDSRGYDHFSHPLFFVQDIFTLFIPALFPLLIKRNQRNRQLLQEKKEREQEHLKAELEHLKYQLQPPFFFNAMNNIYSLIDLAPQRAQDALHKLSKLMRYLLLKPMMRRYCLPARLNSWKNTSR